MKELLVFIGIVSAGGFVGLCLICRQAVKAKRWYFEAEKGE